MKASRAYMSVCVVIGLLAGTVGAVVIDTVTVGNAGNAGDTRYPDTANGVSSFGSVAYTYQMGKFDVTAGQYTEFLNAVAKTDTYGLYSTYMADPTNYLGCNIQRSGSSGSYTYSVASDWANRSVNYVSWGDSARFANWLSNGQPTGGQSASTTEDGSYALNGATGDAVLLAVTRKASATWVIPSEDEWYKAAYYDPNKPGGAGYWDYPTRSNAAPSNVLSATGTNNANYYDYYGTGTGGDTLGGPYWGAEGGGVAGLPRGPRTLSPNGENFSLL